MGRIAGNGVFGRKAKSKKVTLENNSLEYGILELNGRDVYLDCRLKFPFNSFAEYKSKVGEIKEYINEMWLDSKWMDANTPPIITINEMTESGLRTTKINQLIISCMFHSRQPIATGDDIQSDIFLKFLSHFAEQKVL